MIRRILSATVLFVFSQSFSSDSEVQLISNEAGANIRYKTAHFNFESLSEATEDKIKNIIEAYNKQENSRFNEEAIEISSTFTSNQKVRIQKGNFWHALVVTNQQEEVVGMIGLGHMPTTTYVVETINEREQNPYLVESFHQLHNAFKSMNLVTDEVIDNKHVAVDQKGLATFVWAFATSESAAEASPFSILSREQVKEIFQATIDIAKKLKLESKPLPISQLMADKLFVLTHSSDNVTQELMRELGYTIDTNEAWNRLYSTPEKAKPRTAMIIDL